MYDILFDGRDWHKILKPSINHIHQQMHTIQLKSVHKTATRFGSEAPFSESLKNKGVQAAIHQSLKCKAKC